MTVTPERRKHDGSLPVNGVSTFRNLRPEARCTACDRGEFQGQPAAVSAVS